jgi:predicted NAD/FAD-binding protein
MTDSRSWRRQRIAVGGGGISGLASAWLLARRHAVTLFEAGSYVGGHTNTVDVTLEGQTHPVDTGFLVFNDRTYPNLIALFQELGITSHNSDMSFGVSVNQGRLEWAGSNLDTVFAQRRNLVSPRFLGMVADILRFNRHAPVYLKQADASSMTLGDLLAAEGYGKAFCNGYLLPMAAAIWSSKPDDILGFPAASFLRFCDNHGLLQINNRPQWKTVAGGGREYVRKLLAALPDVRVGVPVTSVTRDSTGATVSTARGSEHFDAVVMACHAPDTLRLLDDADPTEAVVLSSFAYQDNLAILHTDPALLPRRRKVWSAWNYLAEGDASGGDPVCVSYLINQLQPLPFKTPVVVDPQPDSPAIAGPRTGALSLRPPGVRFRRGGRARIVAKAARPASHLVCRGLDRIRLS